MPFAEVMKAESDALVGSGFPSSLQYRVDVFLSNSSHEGLGAQSGFKARGVNVKLPPTFGFKSTVVILPE